MKKIKSFYGKLIKVENEINDFLEEGHVLEDIKQSIDQDDINGTHVLLTIVYTEIQTPPIFN